jgi:hypothetical protein
VRIERTIADEMADERVDERVDEVADEIAGDRPDEGELDVRRVRIAPVGVRWLGVPLPALTP